MRCSIPDAALPALSRGAGSLPSTCWQLSSSWWSSCLQRCIAGFWSPSYLPGSQGPSWKSCFPAGRCLGYAGAQGYSSLHCISPFELQDIPLPTSVEGEVLLRGDNHLVLSATPSSFISSANLLRMQSSAFLCGNESCFPPGITTSPIYLLMKFSATLWDFSLLLVYVFWTNNLHLTANYRLENTGWP